MFVHQVKRSQLRDLVSGVRRKDSVPADAFLLKLGKCFPNSLFVFPIRTTRCHLLPARLLKAVFRVQKACCNLEVVRLLTLCCPFTSD